MVSNYHLLVQTTRSSPEQRESTSTEIRFSLWHTFKHHIPRFLLTLLFDIILPLVVYFALQKRLKSIYALLISGVPPLIMVLGKAIVSRTFDALGFLVFIAFSASAIVAIITRNEIVLLLEKSLATGVISLIFAISLIPFRCCAHRCRWRPLAYYFYQDLLPITRKQVGLPSSILDDVEQSMDAQPTDASVTVEVSSKREVAQVYEWIYQHCPAFRSSCFIITGVWAVGLMLEFLGRLTLIFLHLTVNLVVIYGYVILISVTTLCIILTIISITKERKQTLAMINEWKVHHFIRLPELNLWLVDKHSRGS